MQKYKQLDLKRRHKIKALLDGDHSQTKIAGNDVIPIGRNYKEAFMEKINKLN